jgi:hypothetical protein
LKRGGTGRNHHGMQTVRFLVCAAAAMAGACVTEPETASLDQHEGGDPGEDSCPTVGGCGGNSPVVDGVFFWRLHLGGLANPEGVVITDVRAPGWIPMRLELVDGDRLRGVDPTTGRLMLEHEGLEGTTIAVSVGGTSQTITIRSVGAEAFWVGGAQVETYDFVYRPAGDPQTETALCSEGDGDPGKLHALVFGGDLYHPRTKNIMLVPMTSGWVNIACGESAVYKMHKIGYTTAAQARLGISTTLSQRKAMFNAWTANVCGTGRSFTEPGEWIALRERFNLLPSTSPYLVPTQSYEAIWDADGAVCLDIPRLGDAPGIRSEIQAECGGTLPPSCSGLLHSWTTNGDVLTGNPVRSE